MVVASVMLLRGDVRYRNRRGRDILPRKDRMAVLRLSWFTPPVFVAENRVHRGNSGGDEGSALVALVVRQIDNTNRVYTSTVCHPCTLNEQWSTVLAVAILNPFQNPALLGEVQWSWWK